MKQPTAKSIIRCGGFEAAKIRDFANKQPKCYVTDNVIYGLLIYTYEETHKIIEIFINSLHENIHYEDTNLLNEEHRKILDKKLNEKQNENII